ncbi:hypothetical protein GCM10009619_34690 [Williamsia maris]|uniref:Cytidine deaminase n=2 Tax=Williamsia maris TaxID=72806 RepID=A0ABT1HHB3_9NOCA|nr:hypothetical protein [Williamsia maris]
MSTPSDQLVLPEGWTAVTGPDDLDAEDAKLVVLARGAMGRVEATQAAAVRDTDGRTYAAAPVSLPALSLSALQVAVAVAASSGATGLEAAVLLAGDATDPGLAAAGDLGADVTVIVTDRSGRESLRLTRNGAPA